jgi:hypothetical protein
MSSNQDISARANIADLFCRYLAYAYENGKNPTVTRVASKLSLDFEQIVAMMITFAISEEHLIFPSSLPGLPVPGKPLVVSSLRGYSGPDDRIHRVFISYRRAEDSPMAGRIFDRLTENLGRGLVFQDVHSMPLGANFRLELQRIIPDCELLIALVGSGWLVRSDETGLPRLFDSDDPVRIEIETALNSKVPIIPVLLPGANQRRAQQIPKSIGPLCKIPFLRIRSEPHFSADIDQLLDECYERAGDRSRLNHLALPDLDNDSLIAVRVLAAMGIYLRELLQKVMTDKSALLTELAGDSTKALAIDGALSAWCSYLGNEYSLETDDPLDGGVPGFVDKISSIVKFCYDGMTDLQWSKIQSEFLEWEQRERSASDQVEPSREQLVAMSATNLISDDFAIIPRAKVQKRSVGRTLEIIESMGSSSLTQPQYKTFATYRAVDEYFMLERIFGDLEQSLGNNVIFSDVSRNRVDAAEIEVILAPCNTFLLFIGQEFISRAGLHDPDDRLRVEVEVALLKKLQIIPVLLPGVDFSRASQLPDSLQTLLSFNFLEVRNDPHYVTDIERLISFCRGSTMPPFGISALMLPNQLPLHAALHVQILARSAGFIRSLILAIGSGELTVDGLTKGNKETLEIASAVLDRWGQYLALIDI